MSGGSYNYLAIKANNQDLCLVPDDLQRMADRLAGLPYATKAATDTAKVIEHLKAAQSHAEKVADVWYAVEWWDSGDWGEDQVKEALAKYEGGEGAAS